MSADDREMHGHEYDGISEFDNPLPLWWKLIFIGTAVFAAIYFAYYHVAGVGATIHQDYALEMKELQAVQEKAMAEAGKLSDEGWKQLMTDQAALAEGRHRYTEVCVVCHGEKGEGKIGPNLTDRHWIHGDGSMGAVFSVMMTGVPEKGMPPWGKRFSPKELQKITAFVGTLLNTHVPGKEPQGAEVGAKAPEGPPS